MFQMRSVTPQRRGKYSYFVRQCTERGQNGLIADDTTGTAQSHVFLHRFEFRTFFVTFT